MKLELKLYAVRNSEGKFFRAKGYGGYGETWVDSINKAKIYTKIGQARSRVTWFYNTFPKYGMPDIIEMEINSYTVLNETERVNKSIHQKQKREIEQKKRWVERDLALKKLEVKKLTEDINNLENKYEGLK